MPRTVNLAVPADRCEDLLAGLDQLDLLGVRVHRGASVKPPGDVVQLDVDNETLADVMRVADRFDLGRPGGVAMSTVEPLSVIAADAQAHTREHGATTWEELELSMEADSTMTAEKVVMMAIAGMIAGAGIVSDAIHVVIGAMVIAPGFQPFARFVLGVVNRTRSSWLGGLNDVARAYAALLGGAALTAAVSAGLGDSALAAGLPSYLESGTLVRYWTTLTWPGVVVGAVAGICGGLLTSINRTVLTAGVMVALALVPSAALVSMSLVAGRPTLALDALVRFLVEVCLVLAGSAVVFAIKRRLDRRRSVS
ncbi:MAG TPA: DUF389 domain-containing protein [Egibacteraceae bacterium]|nr:DUF389 domain-containing protein [Egibacteraceae bacterium]